MPPKKTIVSLLSHADVRIDGDRPWDLRVHNDKFYKRALAQTDLGIGEAYMDGWWECDAIDQLVDRVIRADLKRRTFINLRFGSQGR